MSAIDSDDLVAMGAAACIATGEHPRVVGHADAQGNIVSVSLERPFDADVEKTKRERLKCFRRGFAHGVSMKAVDTRFTMSDREDLARAYERGYEAGTEAMFLASARECERLGYDATMSILRAPIASER